MESPRARHKLSFKIMAFPDIGMPKMVNSHQWPAEFANGPDSPESFRSHEGERSQRYQHLRNPADQTHNHPFPFPAIIRSGRRLTRRQGRRQGYTVPWHCRRGGIMADPTSLGMVLMLSVRHSFQGRGPKAVKMTTLYTRRDYQ